MIKYVQLKTLSWHSKQQKQTAKYMSVFRAITINIFIGEGGQFGFRKVKLFFSPIINK